MKKSLLSSLVAALCSVALIATPAIAQVPNLINYQGRVAVGTTNFNSPPNGLFKFAIVNPAGTTTYWSNDNTSVNGSQPTAAVSLTVTKGLYSVLLGDTTLTGMPTAIPTTVFANADVRLRVWFNDGTNGFQLLTPDQRLAPTAYLSDNSVTTAKLVDGSVVSAKLLDGSVTSSKILNGAVGSNQLGANAVQSGNIASGAVNATAIAAGAVGSLQLALGALESDIWNATSLGAFPFDEVGRHTAVWTGTEMIVWGGLSRAAFAGFAYNRGYRYNPVLNTWTALSGTAPNAPTGRYAHTAVWTGTEMIVWGGKTYAGAELNDGARYNPMTDTWTALPAANAPVGRDSHTAIWAGSQMIIWGGWNGTAAVDSGGRYDPVANVWKAVAMTASGNPRSSHSAVWTGTKMIVWGGGNGINLNSGGQYDPASGTGGAWTATSTGSGVPSVRYNHTAVWTGTEMIIWGGTTGTGYMNDNGRYNPATNTWLVPTIADAPFGRQNHTAVWTGLEMIIWGGVGDSGKFSDGARYNPVSDAWTKTSLSGSPRARDYHTALWTGSEMIVWGGYDSFNVGQNTGGRLNPGNVVAPLLITGTSSSAGILAGVNSAVTGGTGVTGVSINSGIGVAGTSSSGYGLSGTSASSDGVHGTSTSSSGVFGTSSTGVGVFGVSTNGDGVFGSSAKNGVHGFSSSSTDSGVWGDNNGGGYGVTGTSNSTNGIGVYGRGQDKGVYGISFTAGPTHAGVYGDNTAVQGTGVVGRGLTDGGAGIAGVADVFNGSGIGTGTGVYGRGTAWGGYFDGNVGVTGTITTKFITIQGADVAEPFEIAESNLRKGTVVVIDPTRSGGLMRSTKEYDTRVAGIVSGANGINSGIVLSQPGVNESGQNVAISGRVYVLADALAHAIRPGDMLTTSDLPGHAMKATDHDRAQGAVIGKAMSSLDEGTGMVLVLVTLQ